MSKIKTKAKAVHGPKEKFSNFEYELRNLKDHDVLIEVKYCGICHSDIHQAWNEWGATIYPCVPGHEIAGVVKEVGKSVTKFKVGDKIGVGCLVESCRKCDVCQQGYEQCCDKAVFTYNSIDVFNGNIQTYGGYSDNIVVDEQYGIKIPSDAPLEYVAPLLCAGITTYTPIKFSNVKKGDKVGIAGFGGLGLMAVKYCLEIGAEVYVFARNKNKEEFAKSLGVKKLYDNLKDVDVKFDFILSTIPASYELLDYVKLLKFGGELSIVGNPPIESNWTFQPASLIYNPLKKIYGSAIGGIKLTQEMLDYSVKNKIYPEIKLVGKEQIDEVFTKLTTAKGDFRYVIDMSKDRI